MVLFVGAVGKEHAHDVVDQPGPPVTAGVVGDLLVDQSGQQGRPHVNVPGVAYAVARQLLTGELQGAYGRRVGLR